MFSMLFKLLKVDNFQLVIVSSSHILHCTKIAMLSHTPHFGYSSFLFNVTAITVSNLNYLPDVTVSQLNRAVAINSKGIIHTNIYN